MLFNSFEFLFIFLPLALIFWYFISQQKYRLITLVIASLVFYGYWNWKFVGLMLLSILIDYYCGKEIQHKLDADHKKKAKRWMIISVISNLLILGFFKYYNFFIDSVFFFIPEYSNVSRPILEIVLPVGISFYTFQSMSYSIDIYRGEAKPAKSILHFAAYVSMFPQLIAGPIVRYKEMDQQLKNIGSKIDFNKVKMGIIFFSIGLFKKIIIADSFAKFSDPFFDLSHHFDIKFITAWFGVIAYAFQIYFDFSAYSEMAVGLGLMLGFRFPQNFNSPYKASSFSDFWRRWHITLSTFLRDNLYIPFGGNRKGSVRTYVNLGLTMLIGGLWHGASWLFVIWGGLHGLYLILERLFVKDRITRFVGYKIIVFILVCFAWIFFRSPDLSTAFRIAKSCLFLNGIENFTITSEMYGVPVPEFIHYLNFKFIAVVIGGIFIVNFVPNTYEINDYMISIKKKRFAVFLSLIMFICILMLTKPSPFIYFQF